MDYRKLAGMMGAGIVCTVLVVCGAAAAAPFAATPAPGYYRSMLGDFQITALSDGTLQMSHQKLLKHITASQLQRALARSFVSDPVTTSVNGFLINTGAKLVLVDTGTGAGGGATLGKLLSNLRASGYQPEQVDEIYITHMHGDHIGGLLAGDQAVFPNATVRADAREAGYWLSEQSMNAATPDRRESFQRAMAVFKPYIAAGHYKTFDGDAELVPGIRSVATYGHTPGHTIYVVESRGEKLELWGDLMHSAAVQFVDPAVTIRYDSDEVAAAAQRRKAFADAARRGYWVGAAHLPFPGLGHLGTEGKAYRWVPAGP